MTTVSPTTSPTASGHVTIVFTSDWGVSTGVGEHADGSPAGDDQFEIADGRDVAQVRAALRGVGLEPVMNDYVRL